MKRGLSGPLAAFDLWASSASGLDVTGNWSITGASFSTISSVSVVQSGTDVSLCLNGWGTIATGTVDEGTGAFTLWFDPYFSNLLDEFGTCSMQWTGTFAPDGNGLTGGEVYSRGCYFPFPGYCCLPEQSDPITGTRVSTTVACCGNGTVEASEVCDLLGGSQMDCCAGDCTLEPSRVIQRPTGTKLAWRWREGSSPETVLADFGNPTVDTNYEFCVFTRELVASGLARVAAPLSAAQSCGTTPCWTPASGGFQYRDVTGAAGGIVRTRLIARSGPRSTLKVAGHDVTLFPPLADEVIVQISARDASPGRCWVSTFTAPQINVAGRYIATLP